MLTLNIRNYSLRYKTVLLSPPGLAFLQIQNKDNDDIVVLAPPRPLRQRRCFAAATFIAIALNGSRPVVYGTRIGGEGAGPGCTPIAPPRTMNCTKDHRAGAPSPLAATEALCSGGHHRHSLKYETTQQSTRVEVTKQTIYCQVRRLSKKEDKKEKSGFSSLSEGKWRRQMLCKIYSDATINSWEKNKQSTVRAGVWTRRRTKRRSQPSLFVLRLILR